MRRWFHAFRLRTLPLAISSIVTGSSLAHFQGTFRWSVLLLALTTAILLQVLSNLANDLGDHQHGTDNIARVGPPRAVQSGAISPAAMILAMVICGSLAFGSGIALIIVATGFSLTSLAFLALGLAATGAAIKYTYGSAPYGYAGLGDASVFIFFGLTGVIGSYYLHTLSFDPVVVLPAIGIGLLSTGVLNVNNMRDIHNDAVSGKRTLAVRLGPARASQYHAAIIWGGVVAMAASVINDYRGLVQLVFIPFLLLPLLHLFRVRPISQPERLDPELKRLAMGTFAIALSFSIGHFLA